MTPAVLLAAYALLLSVWAAPALAHAAWVARAPRLGIAAWQALTATLLGSVLLAALAVTVPTVPVSTGLADFLDACVMMLAASYATPAGAVAATSGLAVAAAVIARTAWCVAAAVMSAARRRRRHRERLDVLARKNLASGTWVVDYDTPAAYCLPGRGGRIVFTSAAVAVLDPRQLTAVLAHEHAHLRGRHHLMVAVACGLEAAFGAVGAFRLARCQIQRLVELAADDAAQAATDRFTLAEALLNLAEDCHTSPAVGALAASGEATGMRVRRLLTPHRPLPRPRAVLAVATTAAAITVPVVIATAPALTAVVLNCCPPL